MKELYDICRQGRIGELEKFIEQKPHTYEQHKLTALKAACEHRQMDIMRILMQGYVTPQQERYALSLACPQMMRFLYLRVPP